MKNFQPIYDLTQGFKKQFFLKKPFISDTWICMDYDYFHITVPFYTYVCMHVRMLSIRVHVRMLSIRVHVRMLSFRVHVRMLSIRGWAGWIGSVDFW